MPQYVQLHECQNLDVPLQVAAEFAKLDAARCSTLKLYGIFIPCNAGRKNIREA